MSKKYFEITGLDAKRWALFHIPLGLILSICFLATSFKDSGFDFLFFLLILPPFFILATIFIAWLQASFINLMIRILGKGPILHLQEVTKKNKNDWVIKSYPKKEGSVQTMETRWASKKEK